MCQMSVSLDVTDCNVNLYATQTGAAAGCVRVPSPRLRVRCRVCASLPSGRVRVRGFAGVTRPRSFLAGPARLPCELSARQYEPAASNAVHHAYRDAEAIRHTDMQRTRARAIDTTKTDRTQSPGTVALSIIV